MRTLLLVLLLIPLGSLVFDNPINTQLILQGPGVEFWLGTDNLGRSFLLRLLQGAGWSLVLGLLAQLGIVSLALCFASLATFLAPRTEFIFAILTEIIDALPRTLVVMLVMGIWLAVGNVQDQGRLMVLLLALVLTNWSLEYRQLVSQGRLLVRQPFIEGAKALGATTWRVLWVHYFPELSSTVRVLFWAGLAATMTLESVLSFLGLGLKPPQMSLGVLMQETWETFFVSPHQFWFTCLTMTGVLILVYWHGNTKRRRPQGGPLPTGD